MDEQGLEDSAILLMSLGEEEAAAVFRHLEPKEVHRLGEKLSKLRSITKERMDEVLDRFSTHAEDTGMMVGDSDEYVKAVLRRALGEDKANLLIDRIMQG